ncbi:MAG: hypothetical protein ACWGO1_01040 [Anaerolineales bacterium]
MTEIFTYIPGSIPDQPGPLARFLPPIPEGVVSAWLSSTLPKGALVLDPFGSAPKLPIEAARSGYRLIVTANNPVAHFILTSFANPPSDSDLWAVLAEIAATFRGEERLEPHIRSLYITQCENCGHDVEADAFIWDRETNQPFAKQYSCPHCAETAIQPTSEQDRLLAVQFSTDKLHRARALERVASLEDPDRQHVEEALEMYQPRAVYALFTLINRLDSLDLPQSRRRQLEMLLLSTFDLSNSLWAYPGGRSRPKQLTLSPKFYENNVWKSLESAIREWAHLGSGDLSKIPLTRWPELPPPQGGISLYEGRLKDLSDELKRLPLQGVACAIPRPNQAYWTLCALWTGWLWGRDSVRPLKSVLHRRRYDWNWHSVALHSVFENLAQLLAESVPLFGLVAESEPGFLTSTIIAAETAGFDLDGFALRAESGQAQLVWRERKEEKSPRSIHEQGWSSLITNAVQRYLIQRAEPANYLQIHAAALYELTSQADLAEVGQVEANASPSDLYTKVTATIERSLTYHAGLRRLGSSGKSLEGGQWWIENKMPEAVHENHPLADRVEIEIVQYLLEHPGCQLLDVDRHICSIFPGLLTPGGDLVHICVQSYAVETPKGSDHWFMRKEDDPDARRAHIASIRQLLMDIASRINLSTYGEHPLFWAGARGEPAYVFYILSSAAFGEVIQTSTYKATKSIIVIPGSRANLATLKLKNNIILNQIFSTGWRFLKFRHVYRLLESPLLDRENIDALLALDPLEDITQQMRLL